MDIEDKKDTNDQGKMPDKTSPAAGGPASGDAEAGAAAAETPEAAEQPHEKDHKKHEKTETEEIPALKGKLKKKEHEIKHHKKEIGDLKTEIARLEDRYLRAAAEMDNQRKRLEREKNEFYQFALADLLKELLAVLDNFERALKSRDQTDGKSFQEGVELIHKQIFDLLLKRGVTPLGGETKKFDPTVHQAVLTE
jgi:molecular chaperone GrpE